MDLIILFKKPNFTILQQSKARCGTVITEYTYNFKRYLTAEWPPVIPRFDPPLKKIERGIDNVDVTAMAMRFAGPKRNHISRFGIATPIAHFFWALTRTGGLRIGITWVPVRYSGQVTSTDFLGKKNTIDL